TLEERPELIGEGDALHNQIVAAPHEGAEGARVVRQGLQRAEAMAVGAEQIGEDEAITRITLAARGGVARSARLPGVGMDGNDRVAGVHQGIDTRPEGRSMAMGMEA